MSDLVEFLLARIAEDEAVARTAASISPWQSNGGHYVENHAIIAETESPEDAAHIARHDPARVLAECEAKRRIVGLHRAEAFEDAPAEAFCTHDQRTSGLWPCPTMRLLALPYADHPDCREEWRP